MAFDKTQISGPTQSRLPSAPSHHQASSRLPSKTHAAAFPSSGVTPPSSSLSLRRLDTRVRAPSSADRTTPLSAASSTRSLGPSALPKSSMSGPSTLPKPTTPVPSAPSPSPSRSRVGTAGLIKASFGYGGSSPKPSSTPRPAPAATPVAAAEKPSRNVLRRKPSTVNHKPVITRPKKGLGVSSSNPMVQPTMIPREPTTAPVFKDPFPSAVLGTTLPSMLPRNPRMPAPSIMDRGTNDKTDLSAGALQKLATYDLPPPAAPFNASTGSPSTRYSESPGPFSRTSTPTSISSYSPGMSTSKVTPRARQVSPMRSRPPVTRRAGGASFEEASAPVDVHGLPSLRESITSSSSGSTVKQMERVERREAESGPKKRLSPPPPSPPMRKSSTKFQRARVVRDDAKSGGPGMSRLRRDPASQPPPEASPALGNVRSPEPEPAPAVASPSTSAPRRPSRDGAPDLDHRAGSARPVIQSNLSRLPSQHHRKRTSVEIPGKGAALYPKKSATKPSPTSDLPPSRLDTGTRLPSRNPSPNPNSLRANSPGVGPPLSEGLGESAGPKSARPGPIRSTSRFAIFSKRTATRQEPAASEKTEKAEKPEKLIKKGPAAGTGHEGYAKFSTRGRTGSTTSASGSYARSTSASSRSGSAARVVGSRKGSATSQSDSEMDDFFSDRLGPVVIAGGGGIVENQNLGLDSLRSDSAQSSAPGRPSVDSNHSGSTQFSSFSNSSAPAKDTTRPRRGAARLFGSPSALFRTRSPRRPSTSSGEQVPDDVTTNLAVRRSLHRSNESDPLKIPPHINTTASRAPSSLGSQDNSVYSAMPWTDATDDLNEGREGHWLRPRQPTRSPSPQKRNFLERFHGSSQSPSPHPELQSTKARHLMPRPIAHYALLDSVDLRGDEGLDGPMCEAAEQEDYDGPKGHVEDPAAEERERVHSMLLPDPPSLPIDFTNTRPASPKVMLRAPDPTPAHPVTIQDTPQPNKRSRLKQVGRIPQVVSTRDRNREMLPPLTSVAAPPQALRAEPRISATLGDVLARDDPRPLPAYSTGFPAAPTSRWPVAWSRQPSTISSMVDLGLADGSTDPKEFFTMSPRKGSELSSSSSSDFASLAATRSILPLVTAVPGEDDVWREYDDLLDDIMGAKASSRRGPFRPRYPQASLNVRQESSPSNPRRKSHRASSEVEGPSMLPWCRPGSERSSVRQSSLPSAGMPNTPMSFTDLFAGYGERNVSVVGSQVDTPTGERQKSDDTALASDDSASVYEEDGEVTEIDDDKEPTGLDSEMNVRFGALMTSRWLSFGRVLFSPAHAEMTQGSVAGRQERLLIIDGLYNDDWSYYCALTYPDITVYNLSPSKASNTASAERRESGAWKSPSNHRQIHHPDIENPFPFPKGFFSAVVFRFPVATSDVAQRNAVSECKRVLRPGGHLEISMLDLDLMNMGDRARRAVRTLKLRMQAANEAVSLKPTSDNLLRLLGRRGFENVNRCMLGVPVFGSVADSRVGALSLSELIRDESQEGDEGITKMVANVGRWWYSRCYEVAAMAPTDGPSAMRSSLWQDRALLRECEERKTTFKMLLCYAQKPLTPRRRTVSV
ncbi:MAG: hypothetical protein M1838_005700 [Thelocarpon superellum]|nr:MAG: hypothetical protein M1838_005700 [Thelocarpon superellum]